MGDRPRGLGKTKIGRSNFPFDTDIVEDNGNDPITVSVIINTFLIERILIDDGSVVEVLIWKAFQEMSLDESQIRPAGPIYGFSNHSIRAKGVITLYQSQSIRVNTQ